MSSEDIQDLLNRAGLRPTRQRLALGELLFAQGDCHVTAESLYEETVRRELSVSLATVYNTLHQFTEAGLLREVSVEGGRTYFDTNTAPHSHLYCAEDGQLTDVAVPLLDMDKLPEIPEGMEIAGVDVTIRIRPVKKSSGSATD